MLPNIYAFDLGSVCIWDVQGGIGVWNCRDADFTDADLSSVDLGGAYVWGVKGKLAECPSDFVDYFDRTWVCRNKYLMGEGANFTSADLTGADLTGVDFNKFDLTGIKGKLAECPPSPFVDQSNRYSICGNKYIIGPGAELTGVDLTGVDLTGVDLTGANLTNAVLAGADLTGANLLHVDLTGVDVRGAKLLDVINLDLSGARNIEKANIGCVYGKFHDSNGNCVVDKEALIKVYRESECN